MSDAGYRRFVAIGDSQTEGLWDGDDAVGVAGFTDRLAAMIDADNPGLSYANLAVRGATVRDILNEQLDRALSMQPDLISACVGMNNVLRPGFFFDRALTDLEFMYERLAESDATVITFAFPAVGAAFPPGRILASRGKRLNDVTRAAAARHGFVLVDLFDAPSMRLLDSWSPDRLHGSPTGHARFAAAAAEALGLPMSNDDWALADDAPTEPVFATGAMTQLFLGFLVVLPLVQVARPPWRLVRGLDPFEKPKAKHSRLELISAKSD
jgi:lysophospholipase L1-like esterase